VNAQVKVIEAVEQGERDIGFWHFQNASDFMRNGHNIYKQDSNKKNIRKKIYTSKNFKGTRKRWKLWIKK
jgi:hypothetical protein